MCSECLPARLNTNPLAERARFSPRCSGGRGSGSSSCGERDDGVFSTTAQPPHGLLKIRRVVPGNPARRLPPRRRSSRRRWGRRSCCSRWPPESPARASSRWERRPVGPEVEPTPAFHRCIPTGMRGPTRILWANLTPLSLPASAAAAGCVHHRRALGSAGRRPRPARASGPWQPTWPQHGEAAG